MTETKIADAKWYVRRGNRVQGPFLTNELGRFLLLGRLRNTDRVSCDGELWEPVTQVPELITEELLAIKVNDSWWSFMPEPAPLDFPMQPTHEKNIQKLWEWFKRG